MARRLRLDEQDVRILLRLEPMHDVAASVNRHFAVDNVAWDTLLLQPSAQQLDGVREGHKDQYFVTGLLDNFQHGANPVADVKVQHLSSVRVHRAPANL